MNKPTLLYLSEVAARRLNRPDTDLHRTAQGEADRLLEVALGEAEARSIEADGWEWEPVEGPNGIML